MRAKTDEEVMFLFAKKFGFYDQFVQGMKMGCQRWQSCSSQK